MTGYLLIVMMIASQPYGQEIPMVTVYKTQQECLSALVAIEKRELNLAGTISHSQCFKGK